MQYEDFSAVDLRQAARILIPEARGTGGAAHVGTKQELVELFIAKAIMPLEVAEAVARAKDNGREDDESEAKPAPSPIKLQPERETQTPVVPEQRDATASRPIVPAKTAADDELEIVRRILLKDARPELNLEQVSGMVNSSVAAAESRLRETIESMKQAGVTRLEIKLSDASERKDLGVVHKLTPQIIKVCELGVHQMLVGPAGGGKTTCCEKVAHALGLEFYPMSVGPQTTKSDLLGFIDAAGNYHTTPLRRAFEDGGLILLDELDAANAGVVTVINALLANGYCSFPDGVIKKHEQFRCICACNTYGRGADREYVGRNQLDAATLDRFVVVEFDYDEDLERAMAGNDAWVDEVQRYRMKAEELKARVVISPRASIYGAKLLAAGFSREMVREMVIWKGISKDLRMKIGG